MNHFTDRAGFNGIRAKPIWVFLASQPPGEHPFGAYFTTLGPATRNLAQRLRIPRTKLTFIFEFTGTVGLEPLEGGRGA